MASREFYEGAVRAGVEYLDEVRPDWRERVKIPFLNMKSGHCCILGQVEGNYFDALSIYNLTMDKSANLGFLAHEEDLDWAFDWLKELWVEAIQGEKSQS